MHIDRINEIASLCWALGLSIPDATTLIWKADRSDLLHGREVALLYNELDCRLSRYPVGDRGALFDRRPTSSDRRNA